MMAVGVAILAASTASLVCSIVLEVRRKEPIYMILMKISTGGIAIGAIIFAWAVSLGG